MKSSNFTDDKKRLIIQEKSNTNMSVSAICKKYNISIPTYYAWKRRLAIVDKIELNLSDKTSNKLNFEMENQVLRKLYINLSAHNYELAKFLEK